MFKFFKQLFITLAVIRNRRRAEKIWSQSADIRIYLEQRPGKKGDLVVARAFGPKHYPWIGYGVSTNSAEAIVDAIGDLTRRSVVEQDFTAPSKDQDYV